MGGWHGYLRSPWHPIEVQAVLQYASTYFSSLTHLVDGAVVLTPVGLFWATMLMLALCFLNIASFKGLVRFNFLIFLFKVTVIILTIVMLIKVSFHPNNFSGLKGSAFSISGWQAILSAVATGGVAFAFYRF